MSTRIERTLTPLETGDDFLRSVVQEMLRHLASTSAARTRADVQLYVCDFRYAPRPILTGRYFTANCAALQDENAIVVNEAFLLETEAAVRSFNVAGTLLTTPFLRSDEDLFGLVVRIRSDPHGYVQRLRSLECLPGGNADAAVTREQFALLLLFLIGHELGHLEQGHEQRAFGAFVDVQAPLETRVGNAVVKLARHAREFAHFGFGLAGLEQVLDERSDVGANEKQWREQLAELALNHTRWFQDEALADRHGAMLVQEVIDGTAAIDPTLADRQLGGVSNALFATALYHWQRDLATFLDKLGLGRLSNAQQLALTMMRGRESYVHAAVLFGEVHRFTMLRAILAMDQWLHARGLFDQPLDEPLPRIATAAPREAWAGELALECLRRKILLQIHLDTAVKIAHVGAATGWMLDADQLRGTPQLFMMGFESIHSSMKRLLQLL